MGEGFPSPESTRRESPRQPEGKVKREQVSTSELIVTITQEELQESQLSFAKGHGKEAFAGLPPLDRAEFWAIENGVGNNYLEAEKAAAEAGLDRKGQLGYKLRALKARMNALSRSIERGDIKEFHSLDKINQATKQELTRVDL